jgi:hypothetical protein
MSKAPFTGPIRAPGLSPETCYIEAFNDRSLNGTAARFVLVWFSSEAL